MIEIMKKKERNSKAFFFVKQENSNWNVNNSMIIFPWQCYVPIYQVTA